MSIFEPKTKLMRLQEAIKWMGVEEGAFRRWEKQGALKRRFIGLDKKGYYLREELEILLEQAKKENTK